MFREIEPLTSKMIPAGDYWVGDPCYATPGPLGDWWMGWLEAADYTKANLLDASVHGHRVVASGTAYGDGCYMDQWERDYPVDAGLIGVVPVALYPAGSPFGMHRVHFPDDFRITRSEKGRITIGRIEIETGDDDA